jgi:S-adenosylmethionine:tRNA ribosyltransferase-isomerase
MPTPEFTVADFDFDLPPELIAQHPAPERSASRLLDGRGPTPVDRAFRDLPSLLQPGDLLVFNDTRVIKARLHGEKPTGGAVEALVERVLPATRCWRTCAPASRRGRAAGCASPTPSTPRCWAAAGPTGRCSTCGFPADPLTLMERHGHVPLPPYITMPTRPTTPSATRRCSPPARRRGRADRGAALRRGPLLAALAARGVSATRVTLHVGAGTFQPVRTEQLADHRMHSEWFEVGADATRQAIATPRAQAAGASWRWARPACARWNRPRAAAAWSQQRRDRHLHHARLSTSSVVDLLVTNFHLPRSTLMMLVSALCRP